MSTLLLSFAYVACIEIQKYWSRSTRYNSNRNLARTSGRCRRKNF